MSSWSVLTAGLWPAESVFEVVALEADVSGGVMASRYGVGVAPGAVDLAVAAHRTPDRVPLNEVGRRVGERAWLVPGPVVPTEAMAGWRSSVAATASVLAVDPRVWFVDIGRFRAEMWPWVERSTLTLVCSWGSLDSLVSAAPIITEIQSAASPVKTIIVGKTDHSVEEVEQFLKCPVFSVREGSVVDESRTVWDGVSRWRRGSPWSNAAELAWDIHETTAMVSAP